ncbi:carcinine transporter-like [Lucilia cuprina]|uniref:carcinine transporter-like n=1 Tax=Lucilia cuprina TaxID=7375 RepID=UPI001F070230|nr:carcinine transporter-like [Lucilia cuprina]
MTNSEENNSYSNPTLTKSEHDEKVNHLVKWCDIELTKRDSLESQNGAVVEGTKALMDFDDILPLIGEFGKYQKILFLYMIPFEFFLVFVYFTQIFLTLTPEQHWCEVPELANLTLNERLELAIPFVEGSYSKCYMYNVNFTEQLENGVTKANTSWPTVPCSNGWSYNFTEIPYTTIATDLNWVCDDAAKATYAQSIFFLGAIVGGLLFGWIADKFGRIPSMIACNLVGCVAGMATAFVKTFWGFALMRFFIGFAFDNCFVMMFILVSAAV